MCAACLAKPEALTAEHFCVCCRTPFMNAYPLDQQGRCGLCRSGAAGFDAAYCFGSYENELRELVHLFKYGRIQTLARPLGRLMSLALPRDQRFDCVVPMPMHWRKKWQRGFNQADLLARDLSRRTHLPVWHAIQRSHQRAAQAGLTNAQRRANVRGAFRPSKRVNVEGRRVLLIDDVMTTGSTARACAKALKRAGASYVALLTVARVDRRIVVWEQSADTSDAGAHFFGQEQQFPESTFSGSYKDAKSGSFA